MSRIQEKVKDLIEVRKYENVHDFLAEPAKTLEGYHYTPVTSELMVNWLDAISTVESGRGTAKALAGYRGVGKSHFLATLGAMLAHPELRAKVADSHVFASLHHLKRRHYPVAYVRRGTKKTFTEELITAICHAMGVDPGQVDSDIESLIKTAAASAKELPFVILIDTDLERDTRVSRDDGVLLGELASTAKMYNVFIGVALDDDITDADGVNSAIARTYTIDYLDQEHLYQIVDSHIFPKHRHSQQLIQKLYQEFRDTLPNFRWSEQRFNALYPLHPSILEVAPFVRFYAPSFALLNFASKAGKRILGRPANSLISLDEVFDDVENSLRKSEDLAESFEVYDQILDTVISKIPVMQRLQSKLILKAMFILSLDGNGTTAGEISEAMLIYDIADPKKSIDATSELLETFTSEFPEGIWRKEEDGAETRFGIKVSGKDDLNSALEEAAREISSDVIPKVLRRLAKDKFSDWKLYSELDADLVDSMECELSWRGATRRANLVWNWNGELSEFSHDSEGAGGVDARIFMNSCGVELKKESETNDGCLVSWNAAPLTGEEVETLKRLFVLLNDATLRDEFGEQVRAAGHTHLVSAKKIWDRIFFSDATLRVNGEKYKISSDLAGVPLLSDVVSNLLSSFFDGQYPEHPVFERALGMKEVSTLVSDLFSGARVNVAEVQALAKTCALPLGLVKLVDEHYVLVEKDELAEIPIAAKLLEQVEARQNENISLNEVYKQLLEKPYGLSREAQHLMLAALVAQRHIEFVTVKSDRINHRSLDLKIIWEDIAGIAKPSDVLFDYEKLASWARALTGQDDLEAFDSGSRRKAINDALIQWVENWLEIGVLDRFNEVPDEILNTKIWHVSTRVEKSFGVISRMLTTLRDGSLSLEDALQRIAEAFSDSIGELADRKEDLRVLQDFIDGTEKRQRIWSYIAICESTQNESIENFRAKLVRLIHESYETPSIQLNRELNDQWENFQEKFSEHFAVRHNAIMNSQQLREEFDEILKSDEWWEFECLSKLPIFKDLHWQKAQKIVKRFRDLECNSDVKANLKMHPFCACAFSLTKMSELAKLSHLLSQTIDIGRRSYRQTLNTIREFLTKLIEESFENEKDQSIKKEADSLISLLKSGKPDAFSSTQLSILYTLMLSESTSTSIDISFPEEGGLFTSEELRARLNAWLDDLPNEPILLKI